VVPAAAVRLQKSVRLEPPPATRHNRTAKLFPRICVAGLASVYWPLGAAAGRSARVWAKL
jgi:hypothetical protein